MEEQPRVMVLNPVHSGFVKVPIVTIYTYDTAPYTQVLSIVGDVSDTTDIKSYLLDKLIK